MIVLTWYQLTYILLAKAIWTLSITWGDAPRVIYVLRIVVIMLRRQNISHTIYCVCGYSMRSKNNFSHRVQCTAAMAMHFHWPLASYHGMYLLHSHNFLRIVSHSHTWMRLRFPGTEVITFYDVVRRRSGTGSVDDFDDYLCERQWSVYMLSGGCLEV